MPRTCIVLKWMVSPRDCASYHTDSQEISAFIPECEEKLSVTLACKHLWPRVLRGRHTRVQDAGVMCCSAGAQSMERSVPPALMGSFTDTREIGGFFFGSKEGGNRLSRQRQEHKPAQGP